MLSVTQLSGFGAGGIAPVSEIARDTTAYTTPTNLTTYSSDARSIGTASPSRRVYALMMGYAVSGTPTLSSATIGGVTAAIHAQTTKTVGSDSVVVAIASAVVPTGTTAVVSPTFSSAMSGFACSVIALDGVSSETPVDSATATGVTPTATTGAAVDFAKDGYVMAVAASGRNGDSASAVWTGATETVDTFFNDGSEGDMGFFVAANVTAAESTGNTITATITGDSMNGTSDAIAAISVR